VNELLGLLDSSATVLDLGCGHGSFAHESCPARVIGIDQYIADAPRFAQRMAGGRIHYVLGSGERIPLAGQTVDLVVANHVFEHVDAPQQVAAEISRVLRPTGILFASVPDGFCFSDGLYRWWANGGGHVQRYTFRSFQETVEGCTDLALLSAHRLFSSYSFLNPVSATGWPLRSQALRLLSPGGRTVLLAALNWSTRAADAWLGARTSLYGWAFYFGKPGAVLPTVNREEFLNVCVKCGCGHSATWLEQARKIFRRYGSPAFRCETCGTWNLYFAKRPAAVAEEEAPAPEVAWRRPVEGGHNGDPSINADGVVDAVLFRPELAQGSLVTILGRNLAPSEAAWDGEGLHWPRHLGGVELWINGAPAPLRNVSPEQLTVQIPPETPRGSASFRVRVLGHWSAPYYAHVGLSAPAIISAKRDGSTLRIRAAGLGPVEPMVPAGQRCPPEVPFQTTRRAYLCAGGGRRPALSAQLLAGEVGVYEVTGAVLKNTTGPIALEIGGRRSNQVILE
jgi:uncharacterized protein (TIGR03437 family)